MSAFEVCPAYTDVHGEHVIDIEDTNQLPRRFAVMCAARPPPALRAPTPPQARKEGEPRTRSTVSSRTTRSGFIRGWR